MSNLKKIFTTARPLRVAYLIDLDNCPDELLDAIFAECYGRWAGRRSLIIPTKTNTGINGCYKNCLKAFDADIIYSYLDLEKSVIQNIHEEYSPLYLRRHPKPYNDEKTARSFHPKLPMNGLNCLSTLPIAVDRRRFEDFSNALILDYDYPLEVNRFFTDNFGTPRTSYRNGMTATSTPQLFKAYTLISQSQYDNPNRTKEAERIYETSYDNFLKSLYTSGSKTLTLSMLSEYFTWYLDIQSYGKTDSINLVIGNSIKDRILFWNFRHYYTNVQTGEVPDMVVSPEDIEEETFLNHIISIIKFRQRRSHSGYPITLRTFTVNRDRLETISEKIKKILPSARVNIEVLKDDAEYISDLTRSSTTPRYTCGMNRHESKNVSTSTYSGNQFEIPETFPTHLNDVRIPPPLRGGAWMLDIDIERQEKHSGVSNIEHYWYFPSRLKINRTFKRTDETSHDDYAYRISRANRDHLLSIPSTYKISRPSFIIPSDNEAIINSILNDYEWEPFEEYQDDFCGREKFKTSELSDKGRYFKGFIQHFGSIYDAEQIILNKFWYEIFANLGASSKKNNESVNKIIKKLDSIIEKTDLKQVLKSKKQKESLANSCLNAALAIAKDRRYITWSDIIEGWEKYFNEFLEKNPHIDIENEENLEEDNWYRSSVEKSTQSLCLKKIIFQGIDWKCPTCYHNNWVSLASLQPTLSCEICGDIEPAPITNSWHFNLNSFILEAMKKHGITALIWCLIRLHNTAKKSFYYIPSTKFFPEFDNTKNYEADIVAVVDGKVYVCEVKSSISMSEEEIKNYAYIINTIRPDIAVIAIMEKQTLQQITRLKSRVAGHIDQGICVEIYTLKDNDFDNCGYLPSGTTEKIRI